MSLRGRATYLCSVHKDRYAFTHGEILGVVSARRRRRLSGTGRGLGRGEGEREMGGAGGLTRRRSRRWSRDTSWSVVLDARLCGKGAEWLIGLDVDDEG